MNENDVVLIGFTKRQLELISNALYMTYNKLGFTNNIPTETKEISAELQRKINGLIKEKYLHEN
jgi:hypothetical protein